MPGGGMADDFLYNAFISYSSADSARAERLESDLKTAGLTPFRDKSRLTGGDTWEDQLVTNLKASQHLVLLMSKTAKESDWVTEERMRFKILIDPNGTGILDPNRRILIICLDEKSPPALAKLHAYTQYMQASEEAAKAVNDAPDAQKAAAKAAGEAKKDTAWKTIVEDIISIATDKSEYFNVPVVTFAMTSGFPSVIEVPEMVPPLTTEQFLRLHSIASTADLQARYGAAPHDWKPYGERTVKEIVEDMLHDPQSGINVRIKDLRGPKEVRWTWPDLMNIDIGQFEDEVRRLGDFPLVVIVDPLSLCNTRVRERFSQIQRWLQNPEVIMIILPPFQPQPPVSVLHQWMRRRTAPLLNFYYDPPPASNQTFTGHVISAAEDGDILRVVKNALCSNGRVIPSRAPASNPILQA
jgi:hypothetical protein